ncbi:MULTISPECIES: phosphotransferase [Rhizobium]|uniref:phosphotransferase n=1 Tax=Rhizobium TaxID=379 RepID=UPI0013BD9C5E|nr:MULTISPECIES: phosphotransferase [Rhizobium]MCH4549514.1 phosphotransferase [Rhizobium changzhiense]NEI67387.1 phosphotransferase [Rhizobium leguminosarum]NKN01081.1 phosphotransferase [Rhizobium leguminosarum bv. viciae]
MGVFTELSDADRMSIASAYGMNGLTSVIGIANGDTETTYLFRTADGEFIVTLFENGAEPLDLEQAFETMDNLYAHGVPCPKPIRTLGGDATSRAADRLVAVVGFLPGSPAKNANLEQCEGLGRVMAQIHTSLARKTDRKVSRLPSGSIHGALVADNVFFLANEVCGVINFRLRHEDYLVAEIAEALVNWSLGSDGGIDPVRGQALLRGYQTERVLTAAEKDALSGFVLASAARHYACNGNGDLLAELSMAAHKSISPDIFL